jgi:hypothetical protein
LIGVQWSRRIESIKTLAFAKCGKNDALIFLPLTKL